MSQKQENQETWQQEDQTNRLIIEMKRPSIIRKKRRFEAKGSSLKNSIVSNCLPGLHLPSGTVRVIAVQRSESRPNRLFQRTGTLKMGQASKVLFRFRSAAKEVRRAERRVRRFVFSISHRDIAH